MDFPDILSVILAAIGIGSCIGVGSVMIYEIISPWFRKRLNNFLICLNCDCLIKIKDIAFPAIRGCLKDADWNYYLKPCCNKPERIFLRRLLDRSIFLECSSLLGYKAFIKWDEKKRKKILRRVKLRMYPFQSYKDILDYKKMVTESL